MKKHLEYFEGWKDASDDIADFLEKLANDMPQDFDVVVKMFKEVAQAVRGKGVTMLEIAESKLNPHN